MEVTETNTRRTSREHNQNKLFVAAATLLLTGCLTGDPPPEMQAHLKARAYDAGLEVLEVDPAYTSVIGRYKYARRYGLSNHQAAALCIARRAMNLSERPNRRMGDQVAFSLPVRNRGKHVWSFWRQVARKEAALAAHRRSGAARSCRSPARSSPDKASTGIIPPVAGGTPARESSPALFG